MGARCMNITRAFLAATLMAYLAGTATAAEVDRRTIVRLLPCESAALRLCDRSQVTSGEALGRCAATLVERQPDVGRRCVDVLKSYGQMSVTGGASMCRA